MSLPSAVFRRVANLPAPKTLARAHLDVETPMRDGVRLRLDHYEPSLPGAPTILIRTPYPRRGIFGLTARAMAEQGYHVLAQSCRGTGDSGGTFVPMRDERDDGVDTLRWLRQRPWYSGELCMFGASYLGYTQWALAPEAEPDLKAMAIVTTASQLRDSTYAGGAFSWDAVLSWAEYLHAQEHTPRFTRMIEVSRGQPRLRAGLVHEPMVEADRVVTGAEIGFVRDWLAHAEPDDPYWSELGDGASVGEVRAAVLLIAGWQDIFLPWQLRDYEALRAAGNEPRLIIGPWAHASPRLFLASVREALRWFHAHVDSGRAGGAPRLQEERGRRRPSPAPSTPDRVRLHVGGAKEWREVGGWPPAGARTEAWRLHPGGRLSRESPPASEADLLRYDPNDPTPSVAGPLLLLRPSGIRDNRRLEARPDVLVYTSEPLVRPIEAIGPVESVVYVRPRLAHFDVFVRVCDVDLGGRSWNVCDGLTRVTEATPDEIATVRVELWPIAYRFDAGHRIRVQVSGGAHPRWSRNPGTGTPLDAPSALLASEREILHDPTHESAVLLPVAR